MTEAGSFPVTYTGCYDGEFRPMHGVVPVEEIVPLYVNGQSLVSLVCTPVQLEELALGFLFNEGLIEGPDEAEITVLPLCDGLHCLDIWLEREVELPRLRVITSGCSGGVTFEDVASAHHRVTSDARIAPQQVTQLAEELGRAAVLYRRAGGIHIAALADGEQLLCAAEDIGRHNALDKIAGACLRRGQPMRDHILLTSGRVSSEMIGKAARMETPIVVSRTAPTSLAVQLAQAWDITLIGYTRRRSFRVYAGAERVIAG